MPETSRWLTPQDLAAQTGFSVSFIRSEVRRGAVKARLVKSPSRPRLRGRWRIAAGDARRYCRSLGFAA